MSLSEIERFAADLKSNAALRAEAEKAQADKSHAPPLQRAAAFAASKGYAFTADEAKEHVKAKAKAEGRQLTDAELDAVAGGNCSPCKVSGPGGGAGDHDFIPGGGARCGLGRLLNDAINEIR